MTHRRTFPVVRRKASVVSVALAAVAATVVTASPAQAVSSARSDPAGDVAGPLDVVRTGFRGDPGSLGTFTIRTADGRGCALLRPGVPTDLQWRFDGGADGDIDLVGHFTCVRSRHHGLVLELRLRGTTTGSHYEPVRARQPDRRTVRVRFPLDLPELDGAHLAAVVRSSNAISQGCTTACVDRAPDTGTFAVY